jgi:hypothetical protein
MNPTALPVACDLGVFTVEQMDAHMAETVALLRQIRETRRLDDGWELHFDPTAMADVSRWFLDERRCCPFLSLHVDLPQGADRIAVRLQGPPGTKELLSAVAEGIGVRLA